ncbi:4-(cytidine 5'-diphospho)-2-C-methyl-D-erythritol kinase [Hyphomicrobium methylovorum]|uniref:4-(cytidine 5'-diphospho)-2-C-methyl-D-erythritol kinase n=1 Tax=Hyphomicrobium methylovorum TaxID=84 RepID=UPI0015E70CBE|nr:4-(cytidine 5'-diphospho)-2-C-methyl-D-erythritol kinase [Hyphomicrobium methylovorum]MBA2125803.1 4-(cytidine 5'-diphospho)-2-C-methyl-D-erythritol kinase [Hyphomicrobium methylovorum]
MTKTEFAPAKINLTLEILGRRADGYHELRSLVAFAETARDVLHLSHGDTGETVVTGPFASGLTGANLIDKAVAAFFAADASPAGKIKLKLEKNLPVASGIGGGSADAAAALRLLAETFSTSANRDLTALAATLGADVPVCVRSRAAIMTGVGEQIAPMDLPETLHAVLANPLSDVPSNKTAAVFQSLAASALQAPPAPQQVPRLTSFDDIANYAAERGNHLEAPAQKIIPEIARVLRELRSLDGVKLAQLSGAGPTCFALFESASAAEAAAADLARRQPSWWIKPTRLM